MIIGLENYFQNYDFSKTTGVIHGGAHEGLEFDTYKRIFGADIETHWFEPDVRVFENLCARLQGQEKTYFYNFALGAKEETLTLWEEEATNGESSSLFHPKKIVEIYPTLKFKKGPDVPVKTLDSFNIINSNVLVLDVQGYELEVLKGAQETMKRIDHVFLEVSMEELYEGCPTIHDLNGFLGDYGFRMRENWWTDGSWGDCYWSK